MDRRTRRERTDRIVNRRFREFKRVGKLEENITPQDSPGYFKKNNGFSITKQSSRLWNKICKKRFSIWKFKKRNNLEIELD
jgi:hypothetical protein